MQNTAVEETTNSRLQTKSFVLSDEVPEVSMLEELDTLFKNRVSG